MKQFLLAVVMVVLLVVIVMPALLVRGCHGDFTLPGERQATGIMVRLYVNSRDEVIELGLGEYVAGVVAAEMPASFHPEALKAQAVVARTYAVKRIRILGGRGCDRHPGADLCDDPGHGQAWQPTSALRKRWGFWYFPRYWGKIKRAVQDTAGLVVTYDGLPIDPVYHSTSGGHTENSEDVWGTKVPYLRGVPSTHEDRSPHLKETVRLKWSDLEKALGYQGGSLAVAARREEKVLEVLERSPYGRVKSVRIGERVFKGTEVRSRLGLRSTLFTWHRAGDAVVIETTGYGHGVGMSQYGADGLARTGWNFRRIIQYYYQGVKIENLSDLVGLNP